MANRPFDIPPRGPVIDMTPDGQFRAPPRVATGAVKLGGIALLVAVVAGSLAAAAVALWLALTLIPLAIAAGLVGWGVFKFQRWQARRAGAGSLYRR